MQPIMSFNMTALISWETERTMKVTNQVLKQMLAFDIDCLNRVSTVPINV